MQNIEAPYSESSGIRRAYTETGALDNPFVFKIPVYNNMPGSACAKPSENQNPPSSLPFVDVADSASWQYEPIKFIYEKGIMKGISADTFNPNGALTRGMFATVLYRMSENPPVTYENRFSDVAQGIWYSDAIIWAADKGIVNGIGSGRFAPETNITREQLAVMLHRYARTNGYDSSQSIELDRFVDHGSVSGWAMEEVRWAVGAGIINGAVQGGNLYLNPKGEASRAECAAMLQRFIQHYSH